MRERFAKKSEPVQCDWAEGRKRRWETVSGEMRKWCIDGYRHKSQVLVTEHSACDEHREGTMGSMSKVKWPGLVKHLAFIHCHTQRRLFLCLFFSVTQSKHTLAYVIQYTTQAHHNTKTDFSLTHCLWLTLTACLLWENRWNFLFVTFLNSQCCDCESLVKLCLSVWGGSA